MDLPEGFSQPQARFADEVALDRYRGGVQSDGVAALIDCIIEQPRAGHRDRYRAGHEHRRRTRARAGDRDQSTPGRNARFSPGSATEGDARTGARVQRRGRRPRVPVGVRRRLGPSRIHATRHLRIGCTRWRALHRDSPAQMQMPLMKAVLRNYEESCEAFTHDDKFGSSRHVQRQIDDAVRYRRGLPRL